MKQIQIDISKGLNQYRHKKKKYQVKDDKKISQKQILQGEQNTKLQIKQKIINENKDQNKQKKIIKVHVFPHSHMDLAWLDTFDSNYERLAKIIITSIINELENNKERTFLLSESGFMQKYYEDSDKINRQNIPKLISLIKSKRIEIVNGGFAANDHATTYYEDIIDQMTYGHQFIKNNLKTQVQTGWNVDTFGGSIVDNYLEENMGISNIFLSRLNKDEKKQRIKDSSLQIIMDTDQLPHLNQPHTFINQRLKKSTKSKINTSFLQSTSKNVLLTMSSLHYSFQPQFCIDSTCQSSWRTKDSINKDNLEFKAAEFSKLIHSHVLAYKIRDITFLMLGDDFAFQQSHQTFEQFELLKDYINAHPDKYGIQVVYSTPSIYTQELDILNRQNQHNNLGDNQKVISDIKSDDFFPYADNYNQYWTGFYSSRPGLKYKIRDTGRYLQIARTLFGLQKLKNHMRNNDKQSDAIDQLERAMGLSTHHDAVTGTSKQRVQFSYRQALNDATNQTQQELLQFINQNAKEVLEVQDNDIMVFNCDHNENYYLDCQDVFNALKLFTNNLLITVYNPTVARIVILKMKIPKIDVKMLDLRTNQYLTTDIFCNILSTEFCEIYFQIQLPQYSFSYIQLEPQHNSMNFNVKETLLSTVSQSLHFGIDTTLKVSLIGGFIDIKLDQQGQKSKQFQVQYKYANNDQNGGAYIFSASVIKNKDPFQDYTSFKFFSLFQGKLLTIIKTQDKNTQSLIKYYRITQPNKSFDLNLQNFQDNLFEINTLIVNTEINKEIFLRILNKQINNGDEFETDGNGLSLLKRKLNSHESYNPPLENEINQNLYPVTKMIRIKDAEQEMIIINDRSQAGSSFQSGTIDLLIQRQMSSDDNKGMSEGIFEQEIIMTNHYIVIGQQDMEQKARQVQFHTDLFNLINFIQIINPDIKIRFNDGFSRFAEMLIFNTNIKFYIIYDHWLTQFQNKDTLIIRLQNFDLSNKASLAFANVKQVIQKSLNYVYDQSTMVHNQNQYSWIHNQFNNNLYHYVDKGNAHFELPPSLDIFTYELTINT